MCVCVCVWKEGEERKNKCRILKTELNAAEQTQTERTTFLMMVSPLPGKYELYAFGVTTRCPRVLPWVTVAKTVAGFILSSASRS